jgi:hypothetical protein
MNFSFPVILQALPPILGYMVCPLETCSTIAAEHQHVQKHQVILSFFHTFSLSGRFEAQLLAKGTLGIPMESYMGLCMSLRHGPRDK